MKCIPPWRLQVDEPTSGRRDETIDVATTLKNALLRKIANEQDPLPAGFVQRSRAGYHTAIATELEPNITVTWPLGHMITESDVPDYAELQRHSGHRESSMHAEAAEAKSVTRMKPGSGATDALLGQQDLVALSSAVGDHEATNVEDKLAEASRPRNFNLEYSLSASPKQFVPPFGLCTPEAKSLEQDVRNHVAEVGKISINDLRNLHKIGGRFNQIFWWNRKTKAGSWKAWLQTISGIELDLKARPYPGMVCSCAPAINASPDTVSLVLVAEKETHELNSAAAAFEKEVRNFLSTNGPTAMDKMQKDFGERYRAMHPPPWSLRRWLSGLSGVEQVNDFTQLRGQGNVDHRKNTDRDPKQCYTSTYVLPPKVQSTSSKCQCERSCSKGKHKRSRCQKRSRSHRKQSRSKRDRSRSERHRSRSRRKRMWSEQRRSRSMRRRSREKTKWNRSRRKHSQNRHNQKQKVINTAERVKRSGGSPAGERTGCHCTYSRSSSITPCSPVNERHKRLDGAAAAVERQPGNESVAISSSSPQSAKQKMVQEDLEHTLRDVRTAAAVDTQPGNESAASSGESPYIAKEAIAHKELEEWLRNADAGKGILLQYSEALLREFGSKQELAASINEATPGTSKLQRVDPAVFETLGVRSLGHKLMFAKAITAL